MPKLQNQRGGGIYRPPTAREFDQAYGAGRDKQYEAVTKEESKGHIIVHFTLDGSPSMEEEFPHLVEAINNIAIPAMKGVNRECRQAMRIACNLFSNLVVPAWLGYRTPWQLGAEQLSAVMIKKAGYNGTRLYEAIIEAYKSIEQAVRCYSTMSPSGKWNPSGTIARMLVFTDGADVSHLMPGAQRLTPADVKQYLGKKKNPKLFQTVLVYFETGGGIPAGQITDLGVNQMGFQEVWYFGRDKDIETRRREFRHKLGLFSSQKPLG